MLELAHTGTRDADQVTDVARGQARGPEFLGGGAGGHRDLAAQGIRLLPPTDKRGDFDINPGREPNLIDDIDTGRRQVGHLEMYG